MLRLTQALTDIVLTSFSGFLWVVYWLVAGVFLWDGGDLIVPFVFSEPIPSTELNESDSKGDNPRDPNLLVEEFEPTRVALVPDL